MTTAPEYRPTNPVVLVPTRPGDASTHPRLDRISTSARTAPVLRRLPLPVTEPPFDDQLGLTAQRPTAVAAQGRIVYRTGAALVPVPESAPVLAPVPAPVLAAVGASTAVGATAAVGELLPSTRDASCDLDPTASLRDSDAFGVPEAAPVGAPPVHLRLVAPPVTRRGSPSTRGVRPARPTRSTTPLERPDPSDGFAPGPRVDVDSTATRSRLLGTTDDADAANRAASAPLSDPRPLAAQVVQAVAEILAGDRQLTQLTAWVDEEVYAAVAAAAPDVTATPGPSVRRTGPVRTRPEDRPMVRSMHVCQPGPGVAEVIARVQTGGRSCAVALRLEGWRGRWRCNALTVG